MYAATLATLLAAGILGVLLLNTSMQTQADRIAGHKQQIAALALRVQALELDLDRQAVPAVLAARAQALGLRPAAAPTVLAVTRTLSTADLRPPARHRRVSARVPAGARAPAG